MLHYNVMRPPLYMQSVVQHVTEEASATNIKKQTMNDKKSVACSPSVSRNYLQA
jgi:hypothetical protein